MRCFSQIKNGAAMEALKVIAAIGKHEIEAAGRFVRIGDWVDDGDHGDMPPSPDRPTSWSPIAKLLPT
jgi:hypothetical protein